MIHRERIVGDDIITMLYPDFYWKCGNENFWEEVHRNYPAWGYPISMEIERTIGGETFTWCMTFDESRAFDPRAGKGSNHD